MRKKGISEALVRAVMSLLKGAKTKVNVKKHLPDDIGVNFGVHLHAVLLTLLFAIVVDVVTSEINEAPCKKYCTQMI